MVGRPYSTRCQQRGREAGLLVVWGLRGHGRGGAWRVGVIPPAIPRWGAPLMARPPIAAARPLVGIAHWCCCLVVGWGAGAAGVSGSGGRNRGGRVGRQVVTLVAHVTQPRPPRWRPTRRLLLPAAVIGSCHTACRNTEPQSDTAPHTQATLTHTHALHHMGPDN